jgi:hypothetical protein
VLVALVEAMVDPYYGVEHSGNTPGGETLILLNGPSSRRWASTTRRASCATAFAPTLRRPLLALYLRNVAGFLPHKNDKATFGNTWRVVVPRTKTWCQDRLGAAFSVDMGFAAGDQHGDDLALHRRQPHLVGVGQHARRADALSRRRGGAPVFVADHVHGRAGHGHAAPLILMSPIIARPSPAGAGASAISSSISTTTRASRRESSSASCATGRLKPIWSLKEEAMLGRIPKCLPRVGRPRATGAAGVGAGGLHDRGHRRPDAQQRLRLRAQRRARLSGHEKIDPARRSSPRARRKRETAGHVAAA